MADDFFTVVMTILLGLQYDGKELGQFILMQSYRPSYVRSVLPPEKRTDIAYMYIRVSISQFALASPLHISKIIRVIDLWSLQLLLDDCCKLV